MAFRKYYARGSTSVGNTLLKCPEGRKLHGENSKNKRVFSFLVGHYTVFPSDEPLMRGFRSRHKVSETISIVSYCASCHPQVFQGIARPRFLNVLQRKRSLRGVVVFQGKILDNRKGEFLCIIKYARSRSMKAALNSQNALGIPQHNLQVLDTWSPLTVVERFRAELAGELWSSVCVEPTVAWSFVSTPSSVRR